MLDISKCSNPVEKPKKAIEETSDLQFLASRADYNRTNIFLWFTLILLMIVITCVVLCFLWKFFTDYKVQKYIIDQIINNIIFIILSVLAILKISVPQINK